MKRQRVIHTLLLASMLFALIFGSTGIAAAQDATCTPEPDMYYGTRGNPAQAVATWSDYTFASLHLWYGADHPLYIDTLYNSCHQVVATTGIAVGQLDTNAMIREADRFALMYSDMLSKYSAENVARQALETENSELRARIAELEAGQTNAGNVGNDNTSIVEQPQVQTVATPSGRMGNVSGWLIAFVAIVVLAVLAAGIAYGIHIYRQRQQDRADENEALEALEADAPPATEPVATVVVDHPAEPEPAMPDPVTLDPLD